MNNWIGLLIALSLAIVAGLLNWKYLERKSSEIEMVSFLAIKEGRTIKAGKPFKETDFMAIEIPQKQVGFLREVAVLYEDRNTVISMNAVHNYTGGEIIMSEELKTPPTELKLAKDERAVFISVASGFVPSLVRPGDSISFIVPKNPSAAAPPRQRRNPNENFDPNDPEASWRDEPRNTFTGETEIIGPFRVLSLGSRLGSYKVSRAAGVSAGSENTLGIAVKIRGNNTLNPLADSLIKRLGPNSRQARVLLHPRKDESEKK